MDEALSEGPVALPPVSALSSGCADAVPATRDQTEVPPRLAEGDQPREPLSEIEQTADKSRFALIERPETLAAAISVPYQGVAELLHVGCGAYGREKLPPVFRVGWREIRLDIDPDVRPDVVASITDMRAIPDETVDGVYSSHNIEHLYAHEVPLALREMRRVLKPTGFAFITLPDLQEVARHIADGKLEAPLYMSTVGPIAALDIVYGHRPALARGNAFMAHRTGFTGNTLASGLIGAGFAAVLVQRDSPAFSLTAIAFRSAPTQEQVAIAQARILPVIDLPVVLYALAA